MAEERQVRVRIDLVPGPDQLVPAARRQADELRRIAQGVPAPAAAQVAGAAAQGVPAPAGLPPAPASGLAGLQQAFAAAGGGRGGDANRALGVVQSVAGAAQGGVQGLAGALAGLPGPLGLVGGAVGAVTGVVGLLAKAFEQFRPTLAEVLEDLQEAQGVLSQGRQTGVATAGGLRSALSPEATAAIARAQAQGDNAAVLRVAREERDRARAELRRREGQNLGQGEADLSDALTRAQQAARAGDNITAMAQAARVRRIWEQYRPGEDMPAELANINEVNFGDVLNLTRGQIRNLSRSIAEPAVRAQARVETAENILRTGRAPDLRPGAPDLSQLPGLFQSRQGDVLDLHAQVQQELVRDQRQEQQFQASMRLWGQILGTLRDGLPAANGGGGGGGGPVGADDGGVGDLWDWVWGS